MVQIRSLARELLYAMGTDEKEKKERNSSKWAKNLFIYLFIYCLFAFSRAAPSAYGGSQARGPIIGAVATGLHQSHSNRGSKLRLRPTPQLTATADP